ncbi:MAG: hypothetical protein KIS83_16830 [Rubrivivax sp.]|nr:hypothetical protein [Rubrivivax sp.]
MPAPLVPLVPRACPRRRARHAGAAAAATVLAMAGAPAGAAGGAPSRLDAALPSLLLVLMLLLALVGSGSCSAATRRGANCASCAEGAAPRRAGPARLALARPAPTTACAGGGQTAGRRGGALFPDNAAPPPLLARLQARTAFAGLRQRLAEPLAGSRGWERRAEAHKLNDNGAFAGFAERVTDRRRRRAATRRRGIEAALAACAGAAGAAPG